MKYLKKNLRDGLKIVKNYNNFFSLQQWRVFYGERLKKGLADFSTSPSNLGHEVHEAQGGSPAVIQRIVCSSCFLMRHHDTMFAVIGVDRGAVEASLAHVSGDVEPRIGTIPVTDETKYVFRQLLLYQKSITYRCYVNVFRIKSTLLYTNIRI